MELNIRALELDKVLHELSLETSCADAQEAATQIKPSVSLEEVKALIKETDDAYVLMAKYGSPSFQNLYNMTNALYRAQAGGVLGLSELLKICAVVRNLGTITQWHSKSQSTKTVLDELFSEIVPNKYLEDKISSIILSEDEISDNASPELFNIRKKIKSSSLKARELLDKMVRSTYYQKFLQETLITQRSGRFVVPVRSEFRAEIPGLVHDTSSSGATVFVEPMGVVELNNEVKVLESREKNEIERIIMQLSSEAGQFADSITRGFEAGVKLNVIFAKASLGYKMKASAPNINNTGRIILKRARHPLIDKDKVVPIDIELGTKFDTLVITGPNTGGKTVALKTLGLFTLMAMCGLMIPATEGSEISVFQNVFANIGDEQSIEQSLSTFSSHMKGIISMLSLADEKSLVILDELGSGTDPAEGAALAMAILEDLYNKGAKVAATTHYAELKEYALQTPGVENACCEFDITTLMPTYRLLIGVPGRSNAFAISERLGMSRNIVDRAKELISEEDTRFSDVVDKLEASRKALEDEKSRAYEEKTAAQRIREQAEKTIEKAQAEADEKIEKARREAAAIVTKTQRQADALINELEEIKKQKDKTLSSEQKAKLKSGLRKLERTSDPVEHRSNEPYVLPRPLLVGDSVLIFDINKRATVVSLSKDGNSADVQMGNVKTRADIKNLRLIEEKTQEKKLLKKSVTKEISEQRPVTEVDLRGMTVEEALIETQRAIDAALLSSIGLITVIHGKGTGALRTAVQQELKHNKAVKSYRLGTYGEGESGVTIVELK